MKYDNQALLELREAAKPLMDFLKTHHHPFVKSIVDRHHVEVVEVQADMFREGFYSTIRTQ